MKAKDLINALEPLVRNYPELEIKILDVVSYNYPYDVEIPDRIVVSKPKTKPTIELQIKIPKIYKMYRD